MNNNVLLWVIIGMLFSHIAMSSYQNGEIIKKIERETRIENE